MQQTPMNAQLNLVRVLVVDDHPLMRQALKRVIDREPEFAVVGEAENGEQAIARARDLQPDVIVMDLFMPVKDGLIATAELTETQPNARILAFSSSSLSSSALSAVEAGALGYLRKDAQSDELLQALRRVAQGSPYWPPGVIANLAHVSNRRCLELTAALTPREKEVLHLVGKGVPNRMIAERLDISISTVRSHIYHILKKLGLDNRTQAALYLERMRNSDTV